MEPINPIYAEIISVAPHTECSFIVPMEIATLRIDRPEVAPIPVAKAEIAPVDVAGKGRAEVETSKQESGLAQRSMSLSCPSPSPIAVRYPPDLRRRMEADYEHKRPPRSDRCPSEAGCQQGGDPHLATWRIEIWRSLSLSIRDESK